MKVTSTGDTGKRDYIVLKRTLIAVQHACCQHFESIIFADIGWLGYLRKWYKWIEFVIFRMALAQTWAAMGIPATRQKCHSAWGVT